MKKFLICFLVAFVSSCSQTSISSQNNVSSEPKENNYTEFSSDFNEKIILYEDMSFELKSDNKTINGKYYYYNLNEIVITYTENNIEVESFVKLNEHSNYFTCASLDYNLESEVLIEDYVNMSLFYENDFTTKFTQIYKNGIIKNTYYHSILNLNIEKETYEYYRSIGDYYLASTSQYVYNGKSLWEIINNDFIISNPFILKECKKGYVLFDNPQTITINEKTFTNTHGYVWYYMKKEAYIYNNDQYKYLNENDNVRIEMIENGMTYFYDFEMTNNQIVINNTNITIML